MFPGSARAAGASHTAAETCGDAATDSRGVSGVPGTAEESHTGVAAHEGAAVPSVPPMWRSSFPAMGTRVDIIGWGGEGMAIVNALVEVVARHEDLWSVFRPSSEISRLNAAFRVDTSCVRSGARMGASARQTLERPLRPPTQPRILMHRIPPVAARNHPAKEPLMRGVAQASSSAKKPTGCCATR